MAKTLFCYGTLMHADIFARVTGKKRHALNACARGHKTLRVAGEIYPALISTKDAGADNIVEGKLYIGLTIRDLKKLDDFEGRPYQRKAIKVQVDEKTFQTQAYFWRPRFRSALSSRAWAPSMLSPTSLALFRKRYAGF